MVDEQRQHQGRAADPEHVVRMQIGGNVGDVVDLRIEKLKARTAARAPARCVLTLRASSTPSATPAATPNQPIASPWVMKMRMMVRGEAPKRAQDGDVGALVVHHHDQHRHDVEGRHGDDQQQDQRHHGLLDADGAKVAGVVLGPVAAW